MMKKTRSKQLLRHIKRGLLLEFLSSKHQEEGCSSGRTSTTVSTSTSTSSLLVTPQLHPQPQEESMFDYDEMMMIPKIMLTPRCRIFQEEQQEEVEQEQPQVTMIKPAAPWSTPQTQPSSSEQQIVVTTTTTTQPTPFLLSA